MARMIRWFGSLLVAAVLGLGLTPQVGSAEELVYITDDTSTSTLELEECSGDLCNQPTGCMICYFTGCRKSGCAECCGGAIFQQTVE